MKRLWRHKKLLAAAAALLAAGLLAASSLYHSRYSLECTEYRLGTGQSGEAVRIVHLSDLHNSTFGEENAELLRQTAAQAPDLILVTGDLLNADEQNARTAVELVRGLCDIAPVYLSLGNHELDYRRNFGTDPAALYEAAGGTVLERQYVDITVNGQPLRLGGIYGYCLPARYLETGEADPEECAFLADFQNTDRCTILLCHMPVCWLINGGLDEWRVDCVFSGHVHGGEVILPLAGGVYAPDMGWFPWKLQGVYTSADASRALVLSRGLGTTESVPRWNNIPEVVVVELYPQ